MQVGSAMEVLTAICKFRPIVPLQLLVPYPIRPLVHSRLLTGLCIIMLLSLLCFARIFRLQLPLGFQASLGSGLGHLE